MKITPVQRSLETPTEIETQEHVHQKPARYVDELKRHLTETLSATSRASLIDRWRDYFIACLKAKSKRFEDLL